jgi:Toastrack DUF4097
VLCPECGTAVEADPELSRCQCTKCGMGFFLRRCSACSWVSYVDGLQGLRMPWPCTWCGRFNKGFSQNHDPAAATAAELAAEIARYARRSEAGLEAVARPDPARATDSSPRPAAQVPAGAPQSDRRRVRRIALSLAAAVACAAVTCVVLVAEGHRAAGMPAGPAVSGGATRDIQVAVGGVGAVDFQGVAGRLAIGGTGPGQVVLTGQLHGARGAPVIETRLDRAGGVLTVSIRCATASPCTENLRLAVPAGVGATVRQTGGQVAVAGLSGPLSITAANADVSVSGLRSPSLTAVITSGHLSTAFTAVPRQVSITLTSAQATLHLPGSAAYRVAQEVTSGYVKVAIPQAASATNTVTARIHSGELELMSS